MIGWLENFSFSDVVVALTLLISAVGAYFNLDNKLNNIAEKVDEVDQAQVELARDLKSTEAATKSDLLQAKTVTDARLTLMEDRQRATDVFIGRFDEKMTYLVDQVKQLTNMMEKRS